MRVVAGAEAASFFDLPRFFGTLAVFPAPHCASSVDLGNAATVVEDPVIAALSLTILGC